MQHNTKAGWFEEYQDAAESGRCTTWVPFSVEGSFCLFASLPGGKFVVAKYRTWFTSQPRLTDPLPRLCSELSWAEVFSSRKDALSALDNTLGADRLLRVAPIA